MDLGAVEYRVEAMRDVLADHIVEPRPTERTEVINPKDRHVVEAALAGEAAMLVTNDQRLRGEVADALDGLAALSLDDFARLLCQRNIAAVETVIDALIAKSSSPTCHSRRVARKSQYGRSVAGFQNAAWKLLNFWIPVSPMAAARELSHVTPDTGATGACMTSR